MQEGAATAGIGEQPFDRGTAPARTGVAPGRRPGQLPESGPRAPRRLVWAVVLAGVGGAIAAYLAAYQLGDVREVWDPIFGGPSSRAVLRSSLSRALPVPDAAVGAASYALELLLAGALLANPRAAEHRWLGGLYGALAVAMAIAGAGLVAIQTFWVGSYCSLCLLSALISWVIAALALPHVVAALRAIRDR